MVGVLSLLQICTGLYHLWERGGAGVLVACFRFVIGVLGSEHRRMDDDMGGVWTSVAFSSLYLF
jgi:hypothetical protein